LESAVSAWTAINCADGRNYVCLALKNKTLSVFDVEGSEPLWKEEKFEFDVVKIAFSGHPPLIVVATACGKVLTSVFGAR
jgi:hypothetical protein